MKLIKAKSQLEIIRLVKYILAIIFYIACFKDNKSKMNPKLNNIRPLLEQININLKNSLWKILEGNQAVK